MARDDLAAQRGAPELDAEEVRRLGEVGGRDGPADDAVDAGENEVVDWGEGGEKRCKARFVADVGDVACQVGV